MEKEKRYKFQKVIAALGRLGGRATIREIERSSYYWMGKGKELKELLPLMEERGFVCMSILPSRGPKTLMVKLKDKVLKAIETVNANRVEH